MSANQVRQSDIKPATKVRRKLKRKVVLTVRWSFLVLSLLTIVFLALVLIVKPTQAVDRSAKFASGVIVDGIDISGMEYSNAYELLLNKVSEEMDTVKFAVKSGDTTCILSSADLGLVTNLTEVLTTAVNGQGGEYMTEYAVTPERIEASVEKVSAVFDTEPLEPYAVVNELSSTPSFEYFEGENGQSVDRDNLKNTISDSISSGVISTTIEPTFVEIAPQKTIDDVKSNTSKRSVFTTSYGTSSSLRNEDRIHNILKAARLLNGCVVAPGEEFSFNDYIGPRTYDGGWAPAPGIINGNTYEMQAGGGICQVSTTLHNALMCAGPEIEITNRKNHSWPSSYVDYGLDATVSTGGPDLKFRNNTEEPLYIFAYADNVNYVMTVYIYGQPLPEGITYKVRAVTDEVIDPEETLIVDEPTWPMGYTREVIKSRKGYKTSAYRDTIKNGEVIETVLLYNYSYRPKRGETHIGSGDPTLPIPAA